VARAGALLLAVAVVTACSGGHDERAISLAAERDGLALDAKLSAVDGSLVVDTVLRNNRPHAVYLDADQCGRVTEVVLARTRFEPAGRTWGGSLQAAKRHVLQDQTSGQSPDRFAPRIPGDASSDTPPCVRPQRPRVLRPGQQIAERWELAVDDSRGLAAVGSAGTLVRAEAVESKAPDELDYLDILPTGAAESLRAGRNVKVVRPASAVVDQAPTAPPTSPSNGQLYDRLLQARSLRRWVEAQPADSWRLVQLRPSYPGNDEVLLHMVATGYERAAVVRARPNGNVVSVDLPRPEDRSHAYPRRPATLPAGIPVVPEDDGWEPTEDVLPGSLELPTGRIVVTEYLDSKPLALRVRPGRYPAYATLARYEHKLESVALATLVLAPARPVRWKRIGAVTVDGGTTSFHSAESVARMAREFDDFDDPASLSSRAFDSLAVHDYLVAGIPLTPKLNTVQFSSGNGDGIYPILAGYDATGHPTRIVVDFYLLHLDWPGS
jgi:hypothetical protein